MEADAKKHDRLYHQLAVSRNHKYNYSLDPSGEVIVRVRDKPGQLTQQFGNHHAIIGECPILGPVMCPEDRILRLFKQPTVEQPQDEDKKEGPVRAIDVIDLSIGENTQLQKEVLARPNIWKRARTQMADSVRGKCRLVHREQTLRWEADLQKHPLLSTLTAEAPYVTVRAHDGREVGLWSHAHLATYVALAPYSAMTDFYYRKRKFREFIMHNGMSPLVARLITCYLACQESWKMPELENFIVHQCKRDMQVPPDKWAALRDIVERVSRDFTDRVTNRAVWELDWHVPEWTQFAPTSRSTPEERKAEDDFIAAYKKAKKATDFADPALPVVVPVFVPLPSTASRRRTIRENIMGKDGQYVGNFGPITGDEKNAPGENDAAARAKAYKLVEKTVEDVQAMAQKRVFTPGPLFPALMSDATPGLIVARSFVIHYAYEAYKADLEGRPPATKEALWDAYVERAWEVNAYRKIIKGEAARPRNKRLRDWHKQVLTKRVIELASDNGAQQVRAPVRVDPTAVLARIMGRAYIRMCYRKDTDKNLLDAQFDAPPEQWTAAMRKDVFHSVERQGFAMTVDRFMELIEFGPVEWFYLVKALQLTPQSPFSSAQLDTIRRVEQLYRDEGGQLRPNDTGWAGILDMIQEGLVAIRAAQPRSFVAAELFCALMNLQLYDTTIEAICLPFFSFPVVDQYAVTHSYPLTIAYAVQGIVQNRLCLMHAQCVGIDTAVLAVVTDLEACIQHRFAPVEHPFWLSRHQHLPHDRANSAARTAVKRDAAFGADPTRFTEPRWFVDLYLCNYACLVNHRGAHKLFIRAPVVTVHVPISEELGVYNYRVSVFDDNIANVNNVATLLQKRVAATDAEIKAKNSESKASRISVSRDNINDAKVRLSEFLRSDEKAQQPFQDDGVMHTNNRYVCNVLYQACAAAVETLLYKEYKPDQDEQRYRSIGFSKGKRKVEAEDEAECKEECEEKRPGLAALAQPGSKLDRSYGETKSVVLAIRPFANRTIGAEGMESAQKRQRQIEEFLFPIKQWVDTAIWSRARRDKNVETYFGYLAMFYGLVSSKFDYMRQAGADQKESYYFRRFLLLLLGLDSNWITGNLRTVAYQPFVDVLTALGKEYQVNSFINIINPVTETWDSISARKNATRNHNALFVKNVAVDAGYRQRPTDLTDYVRRHRIHFTTLYMFTPWAPMDVSILSPRSADRMQRSPHVSSLTRDYFAATAIKGDSKESDPFLSLLEATPDVSDEPPSDVSFDEGKTDYLSDALTDQLASALAGELEPLASIPVDEPLASKPVYEPLASFAVELEPLASITVDEPLASKPVDEPLAALASSVEPDIVPMEIDTIPRLDDVDPLLDSPET
jgi:hypothetical protein